VADGTQEKKKKNTLNLLSNARERIKKDHPRQHKKQKQKTQTKKKHRETTTVCGFPLFGS
jgi:hypothetical protein